MKTHLILLLFAGILVSGCRNNPAGLATPVVSNSVPHYKFFTIRFQNIFMKKLQNEHHEDVNGEVMEITKYVDTVIASSSESIGWSWPQHFDPQSFNFISFLIDSATPVKSTNYLDTLGGSSNIYLNDPYGLFYGGSTGCWLKELPMQQLADSSLFCVLTGHEASSNATVWLLRLRTERR